MKNKIVISILQTFVFSGLLLFSGISLAGVNEGMQSDAIGISCTPALDADGNEIYENALLQVIPKGSKDASIRLVYFASFADESGYTDTDAGR